MRVVEEGRPKMEEQEAEEKEEEEGWPAEEEQQVAKVMGRGTWERQGLEAGNFPVVLLVVAGVRGARGEGGGNERERNRMRWEKGGQREAQELLVREESRAEERQD